MGASTSKTDHSKTNLMSISSFISFDETSKVQQLFETIQDKKVAHLMQIWQGQMDKRLQQQVMEFVTSKAKPSEVDYILFAKLFGQLVRGSIDEQSDVLIDLLTHSQKTEPIDRSTIINYVESLMLSFIQTNKSTNWHKGSKSDIEHVASSLCSDLLPQVTHDKIISWLTNEPKITLLHSAVFGKLYQIRTSRTNLLPTTEKNMTSNLLDIMSVLFINSSLPDNLRREWRLLFSSNKHGESFSKLLGYITNLGPTVLVVKDKGGSVFGGFAPDPWIPSPKFTGNDTSFLFKTKPAMRIYSATNFNDHYQYLNVQQQTMPNGLGMGGQFGYWGFWLDSEYGRGQSSETCTTFRNCTMLSSTKEFRYDYLEVWEVGPKPVSESQIGQRSVLDANTEARAMLEMMGKTSHSDGLREPEDSS